MPTLSRLHQWLAQHTKFGQYNLTLVSGDASFRRYYRVTVGDQSFILMEAPPEKEDSRPFVRVTRVLEEAGLNVPRLYEVDLEAGILLIGDLGDELYLNNLDGHTADNLYTDAMRALSQLQGIDASGLPPYDRLLLNQEMELFREWFLGKHLDITLTDTGHGVLGEGFETLATLALEQPQVFVHRDYHSRNLMVTEKNNPGILDYQDAVCGPVTYDLVSLFKDSYITWPRQRVLDWVAHYQNKLFNLGIIPSMDKQAFIRWFDLMGVQRELKVCGIFARLYHRDGKPDYLADIHLTFHYLMEASGRYEETAKLYTFLQSLDIERHIDKAGQ